MQKQMVKEFEDRHHAETKKAMTMMIEQYIESLNAAIMQERAVRIFTSNLQNYATKFVPSIYNVINDLTSLHPMKLSLEALHENRKMAP